MTRGASPEDDNTQRPVTHGATLAAWGRVSTAAFGSLATISVARILGPDGSGAYSVALTTLMLLLAFTGLGVEHGVVYYVSGGQWAARSALRQALVVALASGLVGAATGILARLLFPTAFAGLSVWMTVVLVAALPFALATAYATYVALASDHYEAFVVPMAFQALVSLVLVTSLGTLVGNWGLIIGITASQVLATALTLAWARRWIPSTTKATQRAGATGQMGKAIRFGIKSYAAGGLSFLNARLDLFILSSAAGAAEVGIYSVAVSFTGLMLILPPALADVIFARVAALSTVERSADRHHRQMVEEKGLRHAVLVAIISSAGIVLAMILLTVPLFGEEFKAALKYGLILLPGAVLLGVGAVLIASVVGRGRPDISLKIALLVTPLTIVGYLVAIPAMGATGAAIVSSVSYALSFICFAVAYRHLTGRPLRKAFVPGPDELRDYKRLTRELGRAASQRLGRTAT